jgi:hypothetical protein
MSLIHDLATKLKVLWDHKAILEPQNSIGILSETLCCTQLQPSSEMPHPNVRLLSGDDILFDGWNKGYVEQLRDSTLPDHNRKGKTRWWDGFIESVTTLAFPGW